MSILQRKDNDSQHWLTISDLMSGLMIIFIFISVAFMRIAYLEKEAYTDILGENKDLKKFLETYEKLKEERNILIQENEQLLSKLEDLENIELSYKEILREKDKIDENLKQIKGIAEAYQNNQLAIYQALSTAFPKELLDEKNLNAEIDANTLTFVFKSSDSLFDNASSNLKDNYKQSLAYFFLNILMQFYLIKIRLMKSVLKGIQVVSGAFIPIKLRIKIWR